MDQATTLMSRFGRGLWAINVFGPIFGKELRIASRRRRNYFLRTLYVAALTAIVGLAWFSVMALGGASPIYRMARMNEAAVILVGIIGFFQFFALHLIAPVLTSTAISDEITHRTLGTLMMTPINSVQIVVGKLFSKLLTIVLLVCTSLPLLAIIRIFGGIEWDLVLKIVALTLCAALFAAAISLVFSIFHKRAYVVILLTYAALVTIYLAVPALILVIKNWRNEELWFSYFNPFFSLGLVIEETQRPGAAAQWPMADPYIQCGLLLAATLALTVVASLLVRRVALRVAAGQAAFQLGRRFQRRERGGFDADDVSAVPGPVISRKKKRARMRRVSDRPILWKELRTPVFSSRFQRVVVVCLVAIAMMIGYAAAGKDLDEEEAHMFFTACFMVAALLLASILPAATISSEKEASTWEGLLATPLPSFDILFAKAVGSLRRLLPAIAPFFIHIAIFTALGVIHPIGLVFGLLLLAGPIMFLIGTGTYFSLRVKHTTTAVVLNLGLAIFLWILLPLFALLLGEATGAGDDLFEDMLICHPVMLDAAAFDQLAERGYGHWEPLSSMRFQWPRGRMSAGRFTTILATVSFVYAFVGVVVFGWASLNFRRITGRNE